MKIKVFKNIIVLIIVVILGVMIIGGGVYAATTIMGNNVTYSNIKSGLKATEVQGAIDELYEKVNSKFVKVYTYNQTSGASNYCVTGEESTCKETTCYKIKTKDNCPAGTIIFYKVNDLMVIPFHVMKDEGNTVMMQSQRNIINNTQWNAEGVTKGPLPVLLALESVTSNWSNVNDQSYSLGAYTECPAYYSCSGNAYPISYRTAKARLITLQEMTSFGCTNGNKSCPIWMYNYLNGSKDNGGTKNGYSDDAYWSSAGYSTPGISWCMDYRGYINHYVVSVNLGARAVVNVSK